MPDLTIKSVSEWIGATVTPGDVAAGYSRGGSPLAGLVARSRQYAMICSYLNAQSCTDVPIRLYRPAKKSAKRVSKSRLRSLRDWSIVGRKSADYATLYDDIEEVRESPVLDLMRRPNHWMDGSFFLFWAYLSREVSGNVFMYATDGKLCPMMPHYTHVIPSEEDFIAGYWYGRDISEGMAIPAEEVIHGRLRPSITSPYYGSAPSDAAILEIDLTAAATEAEWHRWRNGGRPDYVVEVPPESNTEENRKAVAAYMERETRGVAKTGRFVVLGNATVKPLGFPPHEMEYVEGCERSDEIVRNAYGVPASLLKLNDANLASAKTGHRQYAMLTVNPRTASMCAMLTEHLLPRFGIEPGEMWFAADNAAASDEQAEADAGLRAVAAGAMTMNEWRAIQGLDPFTPELGDVPRVNGQSVIRLDAPAVPMFGGLPSAPVSQTVNVPAGSTPDLAAIVREATKAVNDANVKAACSCGSCGGTKVEPVSKAYKFGASFKYAGHVFTKDIPAVDVPGSQTSIVNDFAKELDEWYQTTVGRALANDGKLRAADLSEAELNSILNRYIRAMTQAGAVDAIAQLGKDPETIFEVIPSDVLEQLDNYTVRLATDIGTELGDDLSEAIASGINEGETFQSISARIQEEMPGIAEWRADRIARTEAQAASTRGAIAGWSELGIGRKQWILGGNPCKLCEALVRAFPDPIPMNEPFVRSGELIPGTATVNNWVDVMGKPLHPNCTCDIIPVEGVEDE